MRSYTTRHPGLVRPGLIAAVLACADVAAAQTAVPPPAAHTLQADFEAASTAAEAHHCAEAEAIFARLAIDKRVPPDSLPAATIALRRGLCRIESGDLVQGAAWVRAGLPKVEAAGPGMAEDAALGWLTLARLAVRDYDHDGAVAAYKHLLTLPGQDKSAGVLLGLAMVTSFDGDGAALAVADRALAIVDAEPAGHNRARSQANVHTVRARILMNLGRNAEAQVEAEKALSLAGGLTNTVSLSDVSLRADAAEAALLNRQEIRARELLAYTGAGHMTEAAFTPANQMHVPDCDEASGLRPEDNAVVEFSIGDNGGVSNAQTVYTRGTYATARAFAEAVRGWVWQPEKLAKLPVFYRALIRVELRCSKGGGGMPGVDALFKQRINQWATPLLDPVAQADRTTLGIVAMLRRRSVQVEATGDKAGAGVLLLAAMAIDPVTRPSQLVDADHALVLLEGTDPARHATALALRAVVAENLNNAIGGGTAFATHGAALLDAAETPDIAADPLAQDTLRLLGVRNHGRGRYLDREKAVLQHVADDARLDPASPLRQVALLRLASLAADEGHHDQAESLFTRTGLKDEQCALIGDIPRIRYSGSDNDFPTDALRMGFEGWVSEEFDITADGHTAQARTVIAYPPFVFVEGATAMTRSFRYDRSFRPSGNLACSARSETIKFALPDKH